MSDGVKEFNMGRYIFQIAGEHLFVIDNPITAISSMDFFEIKTIDGIYNYKSKSDDENFAIAIIPNGSFYYRTVDKTPQNIKLYKKLLEEIIKVKKALK
jgi:hypothetical protein